jgi:hypothetical protein
VASCKARTAPLRLGIGKSLVDSLSGDSQAEKTKKKQKGRGSNRTKQPTRIIRTTSAYRTLLSVPIYGGKLKRHRFSREFRHLKNGEFHAPGYPCLTCSAGLAPGGTRARRKPVVPGRRGCGEAGGRHAEDTVGHPAAAAAHALPVDLAVSAPLPDVAVHVVDAKAVRLVRAHLACPPEISVSPPRREK